MEENALPTQVDLDVSSTIKRQEMHLHRKIPHPKLRQSHKHTYIFTSTLEGVILNTKKKVENMLLRMTLHIVMLIHSTVNSSFKWMSTATPALISLRVSSSGKWISEKRCCCGLFQDVCISFSEVALVHMWWVCFYHYVLRPYSMNIVHWTP